MPNNQHFNTGDLAVYRLAQAVPRYERYLRANLARRVNLEIVLTYIAVGAYISGVLLAIIGFSNDQSVVSVIGVTLFVTGLTTMLLYWIVSVGIERVDTWQEKLKAGKLRDKYVTSNDPSYGIAFAEHGKLRHSAHDTALFLENAVVNETDRKLHQEPELVREWIDEHYGLRKILVNVARTYFGNSTTVQTFDKETVREKSNLIGEMKAAHRAELERKELFFKQKREELDAEYYTTMKPIWDRGKEYAKI